MKSQIHSLLHIFLVVIFFSGCKNEPTIIEMYNKEYVFSENGGNMEVHFMTNDGWQISISDISWITASPTTGGPDKPLFTLTVLENSTFEDRVGTIYIESGDKIDSIKVKQARKPNTPTLLTSDVTLISNSLAIVKGAITNNGGAIITERGFCWNTTGNPNKENGNIVICSDSVNFSVVLNDLKPDTKYYLKAFATNKVGSGYSAELIFTTNSQITSLSKSIILLIDPSLIFGITENLKIFISDLELDGYNSIVKTSNFTSPEEVRKYFQDEYNESTPPLKGAILIGTIPMAREYCKVTFANPDLSPTENNGLTTQFYSDLNGIFSKDNPSYPTSYSSNTGDVKSEIWISLLPFYKNKDVTVSKINSFLIKNHKYRTGQMNIQDGFLWINEFYTASTETQYNYQISLMKLSSFSWDPFTTWGNVGLYINNSIGKDDVNYAYINELQSDKYLFANLDAHGYALANGSLSFDRLNSISIKPVFVWLGGCSTGDISVENNIVTEIVYSNTSNTLVSQGGSASVGGLGYTNNGFYGHNIATAMLAGKSIGDAYLYHNNGTFVSPSMDNYDFYNAYNIFIGDLSLTLRLRK